MIERGEITAARVGRQFRITEEEALRFIDPMNPYAPWSSRQEAINAYVRDYIGTIEALDLDNDETLRREMQNCGVIDSRLEPARRCSISEYELALTAFRLNEPLAQSELPFQATEGLL